MRISKTKLIIAMVEKDMTTVQLATRAGISRCTISAVKNGKRCCDTTAHRIAQALNMPIESLLEEAS